MMNEEYLNGFAKNNPDEINLLSVGAVDGSDVTGLLNSLVQYMVNKGGGIIIIPEGNFIITSSILIKGRNVSIRGTGLGSILRAGAVINGPMIEYAGGDAYGARGGFVRDLTLHGNNLAKNGLVVGRREGTVVGQAFDNLRIQNTTEYGMVWVGCQNNMFTLLDIEYCGGCLAMLNGAGNNAVFKSEFASPSKNYHIFGGTDASYSNDDMNGFMNVPQANKFYACIFERGTNPAAIYLKDGKHNQFNDCEFSTKEMTTSAIVIEDAVLTHVRDCRFSGGQTNKPAIINSGYYTYVEGSYFEGYTEDEIHNSNRLIYSRNGSDKSTKVPRVRNTGGDIAANTVVSSHPRYIAPGETIIEPKVSEFFYDSIGNIFFQTKNSMEQFVTGQTVTANMTTPSSQKHQFTFTLPAPGLWEVEVLVRNGDWNHTRSGSYNVRFRQATVNSLNQIQLIQSEVVSGSIFRPLNAEIKPTGELLFTVESVANTVAVFNLKAVCKMKY